MPSWARYAVAVYFGLMMSGSLPTPGWAAPSERRAAPPLVKSTQLAPLKKPYRYPSETHSTESQSVAKPTDSIGGSPSHAMAGLRGANRSD